MFRLSIAAAASRWNFIEQVEKPIGSSKATTAVPSSIGAISVRTPRSPAARAAASGSEQAESAIARHPGGARRRNAVEERAAEVVAGLDANAAEVCGEIEEVGEAEARRRLLIQGEVHAWLRDRAS
jgi:hypothetical protein